MSLTHLPSKRAIDLAGIRYVCWDEEIFCVGKANSTIKSWYLQTLIYYHSSPKTPIVILSNYDMYEQDVRALQRELGVPQDTEKRQTRCAEYQPGDVHFDEEYS